jgi:hypothetical protein
LEEGKRKGGVNGGKEGKREGRGKIGRKERWRWFMMVERKELQRTNQETTAARRETLDSGHTHSKKQATAASQ